MFELQKKSILSKFNINFDYYPIEKVRIGYIFNLTKRKAKDYLELQYKSNDANEQRTAKEIIDYLASIYVDLFKVRNTKLKYRLKESNIKVGETFSEFYTSFLHLTSAAKIPLKDYRDDLIGKLTINL